MPKRTCAADGCGRTVHCRGWCSKHYQRWKQRGTVNLPERSSVCAVEDCERLAESRGWCDKHYQRWAANGDPLVVKRMPGGTYQSCTLEGCDRPHSSKGLCAPHYARLRRTGRAGSTEIQAFAPGGECAVEGCSRKRKAQGYCSQHYMRWRKGGAPGPAEIRSLGDSRSRNGEGLKRCTQCEVWKPEDAFLNNSQSADGLNSSCYWCHRSGVLRRTYGITMEKYEELLKLQKGVCALCGGVNKDGRLLAVDHDHSCCTGRKACGRCSRSLLCTKCNTGLGAFGDDVALLKSAIEYLTSHRALHGR